MGSFQDSGRIGAFLVVFCFVCIPKVSISELKMGRFCSGLLFLRLPFCFRWIFPLCRVEFTPHVPHVIARPLESGISAACILVVFLLLLRAPYVVACESGSLTIFP